MEDTTEQGPVDGPRLDGFGFVGAVAVDALLTNVELPASEIGRCGFHGFGVWLVRLEADDGFTNERVSGHYLTDFREYNNVF